MSASKKSTSKEVAAAIVIGLSSFAVASPLAGLSMGSLIRNVGAQQCYYPPNAVCTEYMVPMTITSENNIFNFTKWDDDYALQQFLALATTRVGADYPTVIEGTKNVTLDVEIAAQLLHAHDAEWQGEECYLGHAWYWAWKGALELGI